jgi:competence protein ComEC
MSTNNILTLVQYLIPIFLISLLWLFFIHNKSRAKHPIPIMIYPLAAFICGIALHRKIILFAIFIFIITTIILLKKFHQTNLSLCKTIFLCATFFCAGIALITLQTKLYDKKLESITNKKIDIIATVIQKEPYPIARHKESLILQIKKIRRDQDETFIPANFKMIIYLQQATQICEFDMIKIKQIEIRNNSTKTSLTKKPSFKDFLKKEGFLTSLFLSNIEHEILQPPLRSFRKTLSELRTKIISSLKQKLKPISFYFFSTIFLGNSQYNNKLLSQKKYFSFWGILHYLARSGLHIALFILLWKWLLSFFPLPVFFKHLFLIFLCATYFLLSWPSISFIRALSIFLLFEIGTLCWYQINVFNLLLFTGFIILLLNPTQLFFLDFQLSFSLSIALAWKFQKKSPVLIAEK